MMQPLWRCGTVAHKLRRSGLLWTCSVQRSMNLTGRSPFELDAVNNFVLRGGFYSFGFGVAYAMVTACNLLGPA
jgi:hypothetical protein